MKASLIQIPLVILSFFLNYFYFFPKGTHRQATDFLKLSLICCGCLSVRQEKKTIDN